MFENVCHLYHESSKPCRRLLKPAYAPSGYTPAQPPVRPRSSTRRSSPRAAHHRARTHTTTHAHTKPSMYVETIRNVLFPLMGTGLRGREDNGSFGTGLADGDVM